MNDIEILQSVIGSIKDEEIRKMCKKKPFDYKKAWKKIAHTSG